MRTVPALALALIALFPVADAQAVVGKCTRECAPKASDVNPGGPVDHGPVRVMLFTRFQNGGSLLDLVPPNGTETRTIEQSPTLKLGDVDGCLHSVWTTSPAPVEFKDGQWSTHFVPGFAAGLEPQPGGNVLYAYVQPPPGADAGQVASGLRLDVRIESGRTVGAGELWASGQSEAAFSSPPSGTVIEFRVPLRLAKTYWDTSPERGFVVDLRFCNVDTMPVRAGVGSWQFTNAADFSNRLILNVSEPVKQPLLRFDSRDGKIWVRATWTPAFGSYDLDDKSVRLEAVSGPRALSPQAIDFVVLKRSVDHDGHFSPINATWAILPHALRSPDPWQVRATATNLQGTFLYTATAPFSLTEFQGGSRVPGFEAACLLLTLGCLVAASRRRG